MTIKLDGTNGITNVNGTAAAPAETGTTSTNTGISFGTNTVTVSTAGSARATFDASGNLGIGTTSPAAKLDLGSGTLNFSSTAQRIIGDFTNATVASRVMFQTSTTNGGTAVGLIPNGTNVVSNFNAFTSSDPTNSSFGQLRAEGTGDVRLSSGITGTGTYLPMTFYTNGSERMRIDTSGNVGIGTTTPTQKLDVTGSANVSGTVVMGSSFLRNRIINGDMRIDQRNAGAQITAANLTNETYMVDRWKYQASQAAKFTAQQNAGSVTTAVGFPNYLGMTVATAVTVGASDYFHILQAIEGFNFADLAWGTASAKTVTLSFVVYSSLTGTFGGALRNGAASRSYPFTYTISSANTWTTISVTIAGDTSGTWVGATNGIGVQVGFGLGVGTTYSGTGGAWASANYVSATGATSVVGTNGATFYITGVQLEVGSVATPFERRLYGQELVLCQRYYDIQPFTANAQAPFGYNSQPYRVVKRVAPTITTQGTLSGATYVDMGGTTAAAPNGYAVRQNSAASTATDVTLFLSAEL